jgi:hypothetical protein
MVICNVLNVIKVRLRFTLDNYFARVSNRLAFPVSINLVRVSCSRCGTIDSCNLGFCTCNIIHFKNWNNRQVPDVLFSNYLLALMNFLRIPYKLINFNFLTELYLFYWPIYYNSRRREIGRVHDLV